MALRSSTTPNGSVWLGSNSGQLTRVELASGATEQYGVPERVYAFSTSHFFDDDNQVLWVTGLGFTRIDVATGLVKVYSFDASNPGAVANQLWSVDQGTDGHLWLASSSGIHEFDPATGTYVALYHDALPIPEATDARFGPDGLLWSSRVPHCRVSTPRPAR